jgi:hypothetical protein
LVATTLSCGDHSMCFQSCASPQCCPSSNRALSIIPPSYRQTRMIRRNRQEDARLTCSGIGWRALSFSMKFRRIDRIARTSARIARSAAAFPSPHSNPAAHRAPTPRASARSHVCAPPAWRTPPRSPSCPRIWSGAASLVTADGIGKGIWAVQCPRVADCEAAGGATPAVAG